MGGLEKYTHKQAPNQIGHCERLFEQYNNKDIDHSRTHLNYSLTPERDMSSMAYYQQRKAELYCYGRSDVKTLAGWVITAPKELETLREERAFFENTYKFLESRYGQENVISANVHYDEGKIEKVKDRWGEYIRDEDGTIKTELVLGRPHIHFLFIPVVKDNSKKHIAMGFEEKICANKVLTRDELRRFHGDLSQYLKHNNVKGEVLNGSTKAQGRNYTVAELKERYETQKELERLREIEQKYNMEHQRMIQKTSRWQ